MNWFEGMRNYYMSSITLGFLAYISGMNLSNFREE